jgi:hypothetical protein
MSTDFLKLNSCGPKGLFEGLPGLGRGLEKYNNIKYNIIIIITYIAQIRM